MPRRKRPDVARIGAGRASAQAEPPVGTRHRAQAGAHDDTQAGAHDDTRDGPQAGVQDGTQAGAAIYVADTGTVKGRGVFAARDLAAGTLVERCDVLPFRMSFDKLSRELQHCVFNWSEDDEALPFHAHALGSGSFYNHANPANMRYEADRPRLEMRFITVVDVRAGTELTINYNAEDGGPTWDDDYWFEEMGIKRV